MAGSVLILEFSERAPINNLHCVGETYFSLVFPFYFYITTTLITLLTQDM